jgi:hypothetical protein
MREALVVFPAFSIFSSVAMTPRRNRMATSVVSDAAERSPAAHERSAASDVPGECTRRTGAQILCDALEQEGVDVLFGYPGGAIMPFYDALTASSLRHVLVRHEQAAAHAADGYARATGRVGVCVPARPTS